MSMPVAAESAISSSRRGTLLQKFKKLPLTAQGELICLIEMEAICQFYNGNQPKAIQLCQQQIEIELSLFGKSGEGLHFLKAKLRLFMFVGPAHPLANEILKEMYDLFCCSANGILTASNFLILCKKYVPHPPYHPHISDWMMRATNKKTITSNETTPASGEGVSTESKKQKKKKGKK